MLNEIKKGIVKGSFYTSLGQLISITFLFISTAILARFIPSKDLGLFFILLSISALLEMFTSIGLEPTLIKFQSQINIAEKDIVFYRLLTLRIYTQLIISAFYLIIILLLGNVIEEDWFLYNYYILILFNLSSIRNFLNAYLQSNKLFKSLTFVQLVQTLSKVLAYLFFTIFGSLSISNLMAIEIGSILISFIFQMNIFSNKIKIYPLNFEYIKKTISFSIPLYLNNFLHVFSARMNNFIIAYFTGLSSVASYEISRKIPDAFNRLSSSLTLVYYPYIAELLSKKNLELAENILNSYLRFLFLLYTPGLVIFYLFKEDIIYIIFSANYTNISLGVFILLIAYIFSFTSSIMGYTLVATGNSIFSFRINLTRTIMSLLFSIPLIYFYGYMGAIYSLLLSNIYSFSLSIIYLKRVRLKVNSFALLRYIFITLITISLILFFDYLFKRQFLLSILFCVIFLLLYFYNNRDLKQIFYALIRTYKK